ncbi:MAG: hypothetical protein AB9M53_09135 [Leptothrix sp. (in: b-proteobacteria)]
MSIKQLLFRDEARARILRGVDTLAEAVHPMDLKRGMGLGAFALGIMLEAVGLVLEHPN